VRRDRQAQRDAQAIDDHRYGLGQGRSDGAARPRLEPELEPEPTVATPLPPRVETAASSRRLRDRLRPCCGS
jgi:hypothetical protein